MRQASRAAQHYKQQLTHSMHKRRRKARNEYTKLLKRMKKEHYDNWIKSIDQKSI